MSFKFAELQGTKQQYDNTGAHAEVVKMMQRGEKLKIKLRTSKDRHPYAWIESKNVAGFKYELNEEKFQNLLIYLTKGEVCRYESAPTDIEELKEGEDFQMEVLKSFVEDGVSLQYTPLFREYDDSISAMKSFQKGTIYFRIPRTSEILDYLRENEQPI